jgi:HEAT repeat protein
LIDQEKIHNLCLSDDLQERIYALDQLQELFSSMPDKQQAWNDLHRLTNDLEHSVRFSAVYALGSAFFHVLDKQQAWNDLIRLTKDKVSYVRSSATNTLGFAFVYVPDKQQTWNDLHRLTKNETNYVRSSAANALGSAFSHVPGKQQAWNDLHRLTKDEDWNVRYRAAVALGSAFSQVPDKQQAWNVLLRLTKDEANYVRTSSNHSLGRVSIFKASQAETDEDYKKELEKAIVFFETAEKEASYYNPAQFCLPFYRSFHTIIFKKQDAKEEVDKYLEEAKVAIESSKSKKALFDAVENLAEALKEVHNLGNPDLQGIKGELNFYRKYCDRAAELMKDTDKKAPFATEVLRKGLPILDRNLKKLIEEIQEKAKIACKESKGTDAEGFVCEINKQIQNLASNDQGPLEILENIFSIVKIKIPRIPENGFVLSKIEAVDNKSISPEKYVDLPLIISLIPTVKVISEQELDRKLIKLDLIYTKTISIEAKLDLIQRELDKGIEKLDILSTDIEGKEGELIKVFSKQILELKERGNQTACGHPNLKDGVC